MTGNKDSMVKKTVKRTPVRTKPPEKDDIYHSLFKSSGIATLIAGEDGTLKNRLPTSMNRGFIRAKTGTLDGVTSLAGFLQTIDGEMVAFAVILNDPKNKQGKMSGWADQIATTLSRFSRK